MYEITQALTTEAGLPAYEISNHAVPGAESRHNLVYWRSGDWIGIGPGAHGRLEFDGIRYATEAPKAPGAWLSQVESGRGGEIDRVRLSSPEGVEERLMMGLRLAEGVQLPEKIDLLAEDFDRRVDALAELGLLNRVQDRLVASEAGRPILNGVLRELLT